MRTLNVSRPSCRDPSLRLPRAAISVSGIHSLPRQKALKPVADIKIQEAARGGFAAAWNHGAGPKQPRSGRRGRSRGYEKVVEEEPA